MGTIAPGALYAIWFVWGLFQLFAVIDGIEWLLGVGTFVAVILSVFVNWIPLAGTAFGILGAYNVWDWPLWLATVLFVAPLGIIVLVSMAGAALDRRA